MSCSVMEGVLTEMKNISAHENIDFLSHVGVRKFYNNGDSIGMTSNDRWNDMVHTQYIKPALRNHYVNELKFIVLHNSQLVLKVNNQLHSKFLQILSEVHMCNSVGLYRKNSKGIRAYFFTAPPFFYDATQIFINKTQIFSKIVDVVDPVIEQLEYDTSLSDYKDSIFTLHDAKELFRNIQGKTGYAFTNARYELTKYRFTDKELQILAELSHTSVTKAIARTLSIAPKTVDWHISNIKSKLNLYSRADLQQFSQSIFYQ